MTAATTRRTAKLTTSAPRGYTVVQCSHIAPQTQRIACVAKCDMAIQGVNGASVSLKAHEAFWLVRAGNLGPNAFYVVREEVGVKKCSCPASRPCKHEIALAAHIAKHGRSALHLRATVAMAEASKAKAQLVVAENEAREAVRRKAENDRRMASTLNGNQGFSLLKRPA